MIVSQAMKRGKILAFGVGVFLSLASFELALRLGGALYRSASAPPNAVRKEGSLIICAGDSITWGVGGYSYPSQLQERLDRDAGPGQFQVLNMGVPGITSSDLVERLTREIPDKHPKLIIIMTGINDRWNGNSPDVNIERIGRLRRIDQWLLRLKTYKFFKAFFFALERRREGALEWKLAQQWSLDDRTSASPERNPASPVRNEIAVPASGEYQATVPVDILRNRGDDAGTLREIRAGLERSPLSTDLNTSLIQLHLERGEQAEAEKAFEQAKSRGAGRGTEWIPETSVAILRSHGDDSGAVRVAREGLLRFPRSFALNDALIHMCLELGELDAAQKAYERAAALKFLHGTVWTWKVLADILDKRGDDAGALRAVQTGLQRYPRSIALNAALIKLQLKHTKDAARKTYDLYTALIERHLERGEQAEAEKAFEQAKSLGVGRGAEWIPVTSVAILRGRGDVSGAVRVAREGLLRFPRSFALNDALIRMYLDRDELGAAQKVYEQAAALKIQDGTIWTWTILGRFLDKRGDDAGALRAVRRDCSGIRTRPTYIPR